MKPANDGQSGHPEVRRKSRWVTEVLVIVVSLSIPAWCLLSPIFTSKNFGKPPGRAIPLEPPDESRRVGNPQGFSMVFPEAWEVSASDVGGPPEIQGHPRSLIASRGGASLRVVKHGEREPDDLSSHHPVEFQGIPARLWQGVKEVWYEREPAFVYDLVFEREGCFYQMHYIHPDQLEILPGIIGTYLATFRIEEPSQSRESEPPIIETPTLP